jgi:hypothetical protein
VYPSIAELESQLKEVVRNQEHLQDALSSLNKEFSEFKLQQYQRPPKPQPLTQEEQMQRNISELKELKLGQVRDCVYMIMNNSFCIR